MLEMLMRQGKVIIDDNLCTRWCFSNCQILEDSNANAKPVKAGRVKANKIDVVISMLMALGAWQQDNYEK